MWKQIAVNTIGGLVNNALAQSNAREQRQWQEDMMDKQNEYNNPSNMASRLRQAGLNPNNISGAQSSASTGNGAVAQTIPIDNPLEHLKAFAEVDNIVAQTGKTETETSQILKNMSMLDLAYQRGLMEKDEYERRLELLFEEWSKANPYTVEREKTQAETVAATASAGASQAQESYFEALTDTEDELRSLRSAFLSAQTDTEKSKQHNLYIDALAKHMHSIVEKNKDDREAIKAPLERLALQLANDLGATESELTKVREGIANIWYDESRPKWVNAILDFVHSNVRLGGSASYSKTSK